ncbi:MAG TPA: hypothetical protein VGI70_02565, partial [Polyangiales bacterium]
MIGCSQLLFALGLSRFLPLAFALPLTAALYVATTLRFTAQMRDRPRPRFVTRFVDTPLFWHFGASTFMLVCRPLCVAFALLVGLFEGATVGGVFLIWRV